MEKTQYPGLSTKEPIKDQNLIDIYDRFVKVSLTQETLLKAIDTAKLIK